jgi:hypothetical protein
VVRRRFAKPLAPPNKYRLPPKLPALAGPWDTLTAGGRKLGAGLAMRGQKGGHGFAVAHEVNRQVCVGAGRGRRGKKTHFSAMRVSHFRGLLP